MKCPRCDISLPDNTEVCPLCHTPLTTGRQDGENKEKSVHTPVAQDTGRFSAIDPSKDTYDFDLQYTLTFKDAGEIRQAIADMELGIGKDHAEELLHPEKAAAAVEKKPEHRQRTREEMEEAAQRAALRRERRNKQRKGGHNSGKRTHVVRMSRTEREKAAALRAAKAKSERSPEKSMKNRRFVFSAGVAVIVVAIIIGAINLFAGMIDGDVHYPTVYTKNNQLYMVYDKKPQQLSQNFISAYAAPKPTATATTKPSSTQKPKTEDPKKYKNETATEKQLISVSADGLYTFFLENVDLNNGCGDLVYYQNDTPKERTVIASSVYYKTVISKDGKSVLYLKNTDETGYHGELCYWNAAQKQEVSVEQNICSENFVFTQDGLAVLYIKNFNPIVNTGDLCVRSFAKDASQENKVIDEKVAFVFGSTPKSNIYLYAKDYNTETGVYNLYVLKENEAPAVYAENAFLPPVILEKTEGIYAYSNYHDNFQTISYIDFATGQTNQMAEDITRIERVRKDEGAVIYTKTYETNKSDYYYIAASETASQKIANAVVEVQENPQGKILFDASDDFSRIAYIGGYDEENCKGALFTLNIINGYAGTEKRISDDAYSCDVSADGAIVRFASSYNRDAGTVNLVSYSNSNTVTLTEGVSAGAFTYDKIGEAMVYARNVQMTPTTSGDVECVSSKGKIRQVDTGVNSYGLKQDGTILLLKKDGEGENPVGKLYYSNQKGSKIRLMDEGVSAVVLY
ncbi:hypothetical protein [Ructibacterium gallinarum]|uniref:Uncharacterized protein n=1 Tax=Ructibacterium gallinarum TaxID=2779355 RepID=A0A9D5LYF2_9FIRM|nr:hypothetical protein [Ructibacterium gallinarum]MBE5040291.1 hypothetical protein [Ructibacterium gallinarum]